MNGFGPSVLVAERWEHGSEFHAIFDDSGAPSHPWTGTSNHYGCGRDALKAILAEGRDHRGWKRVWVPSYFCQEVVESMLHLGLLILPYAAGPEEAQPSLEGVALQPGDAVLRVNQFGLQDLGKLRELRKEGIEYIDDHTHDPWSFSAWNSDADFCVASLRKTVPVPDGGVLWSPLGHPLPKEPALSSNREAASTQKLVAMLLKKSYLRGEATKKDLFRGFAMEGERGMGEGDPSGMTPWSREMMERMPLDQWREQRRSNHQILSAAITPCRGFKVLPAPPQDKSCPFLVVLVFDRPEERDAVKQALMAAHIYPGTHWPMSPPVIDGIPERHQDLSRRILTLNCDMRYRERDLRHVAAVFLEMFKKLDRKG